MHTNDLRYESKDSLDIEKGSFSARAVRCEGVVGVLVLNQEGPFSVGDGYTVVRTDSRRYSGATYWHVLTIIANRYRVQSASECSV